MTTSTEIETFRTAWNAEAANTLRVLESLPPDQYDFRPDPAGRTLGQMAWHLSEIDACLSFGIAEDRFSFADEPPHLKRPPDVAGLIAGYRLIHEEAVARIATLSGDQLDRRVTFFDQRQMTIRDVLWVELLHHLIHHRGQLVLLCRQAGGQPPGLFGPNREEMHAMQAK